MGDGNEQPERPAEGGCEDTLGLGGFRGVVLDDVGTVQTVPEPPAMPAQPPATGPGPADETG